MQTLVLSYAYHCCAFLPLLTLSNNAKMPPLHESVLFPTDNEFDMSLWNSTQTDIWPQLRKNFSLDLFRTHKLAFLTFFFLAWRRQFE